MASAFAEQNWLVFLRVLLSGQKRSVWLRTRMPVDCACRAPQLEIIVELLPERSHLLFFACFHLRNYRLCRKRRIWGMGNGPAHHNMAGSIRNGQRRSCNALLVM